MTNLLFMMMVKDQRTLNNLAMGYIVTAYYPEIWFDNVRPAKQVVSRVVKLQSVKGGLSKVETTLMAVDHPPIISEL